MLSVNSSRCCCKRYPGLVSMALWWRSGWSLEIQTSAFKRWAAGEEEEERTRYLLARLEGLSVGKVKTQTVKIFGKGYRRTRPLQDLRSQFLRIAACLPWTQKNEVNLVLVQDAAGCGDARVTEPNARSQQTTALIGARAFMSTRQMTENHESLVVQTGSSPQNVMWLWYSITIRAYRRADALRAGSATKIHI